MDNLFSFNGVRVSAPLVLDFPFTPSAGGEEPVLIHVERASALPEEGVSFESSDGIRSVVVAKNDRYVVTTNCILEGRPFSYYLLSTVFPWIFLQEDMLIVHGSSVSNGVESYCIMGDGGAGKSTSAIHFVKRGYSLISDSYSVLGCSSQQAVEASESERRVLLWEDSAELLGGMKGVRRLEDLPDGKGHFQLATRSSEFSRLTTLIFLSAGREKGIRVLSGSQALFSLLKNTYGVEDLCKRASDPLFASIEKLVAGIRILEVVRPIGDEHFTLPDLIQGDCEFVRTSERGEMR